MSKRNVLCKVHQIVERMNLDLDDVSRVSGGTLSPCDQSQPIPRRLKQRSVASLSDCVRAGTPGFSVVAEPGERWIIGFCLKVHITCLSPTIKAKYYSSLSIPTSKILQPNAPLHIDCWPACRLVRKQSQPKLKRGPAGTEIKGAMLGVLDMTLVAMPAMLLHSRVQYME